MGINDVGIQFIQESLNSMGANLIVDGMWGPRTKEAFIRLLNVPSKSSEHKSGKNTRYDIAKKG